MLCLGLPAFAHAEPPADDIESAYFEQLPIVLTAARLPQSLQDAPGAITVIDRKLIERSGYRDLARLLRLVPGMQVGQERGSASWVSYHGLGQSFPGELQVLIDGAAAYVPISFGTAAWTGLPVFLSEIERIEVVRGASGNSYGASALLGAVNLITRPAAEDPGAHARLVLGDPSVRDVEVGWSGASAPLALRLTAGEQSDGGFRGLHDHRLTQRFSLRGDTQWSAQDTLSVRLGSSREVTGRGYPDSPFGNNALRDGTDSSHLFHVRWQHIDDIDREWSLSAYHHQLDYQDAWLGGTLPTFPDIPLSRDRRDLRTSIEFQKNDRWAERVRGIWGVEATLTQTRSPFSFHSSKALREETYRLFSNAEWQPTEKTKVNLGLAAERSGHDGWRISPRLFANHRLSPADTVRVGVARAWRSTSPFELHGDTRVTDPTSGLLLARPFVPNPDLRQTRADTVELGYIRQMHWARSTAEVRLFQERLHDLVVRERVTSPAPIPLLAAQIPTTRAANYDGELTVRGIELQLESHPWQGGELRLAWSLIDRRAADSQIEAAIAPYTASLLWMQQWPQQWSSLMHLTRIGPVASGDSYLAGDPYVVRAYTSLDLALSRPVNLAGQPARLTLAALNLGPRHQEVADRAVQAQHGNTPANRVSRQVYLRLDMRF